MFLSSRLGRTFVTRPFSRLLIREEKEIKMIYLPQTKEKLFHEKHFGTEVHIFNQKENFNESYLVNQEEQEIIKKIVVATHSKVTKDSLPTDYVYPTDFLGQDKPQRAARRLVSRVSAYTEVNEDDFKNKESVEAFKAYSLKRVEKELEEKFKEKIKEE